MNQLHVHKCTCKEFSNKMKKQKIPLQILQKKIVETKGKSTRKKNIIKNVHSIAWYSLLAKKIDTRINTYLSMSNATCWNNDRIY